MSSFFVFIPCQFLTGTDVFSRVLVGPAYYTQGKLQKYAERQLRIYSVPGQGNHEAAIVYSRAVSSN